MSAKSVMFMLDPFIRDVLIDIHKNLSACFGAAEIADRFKIARKTLDRRFRAGGRTRSALDTF